jgi:hypothetical protein
MVTVFAVCAHELATVVAVVSEIRLSRVLCAAVAADQAVIAVLSAIWLILRIAARNVGVESTLGAVI